MAEDAKSAEAEVREKLARLQTAKAKLDAFDGEISQLVPTVEEMLSSLRLGVPISQKIDENEDGWVGYLTFEKVGKKRRLCVVTGIEWENERTTTPLSDVARDYRADIFERFLPGILDTALEEMETRVVRRQKSIEAARNLVETVGKVTGENRGAADRSTFHLKEAFEAEHVLRGLDSEAKSVVAESFGGVGFQGHPGTEKVTSETPLEVIGRQAVKAPKGTLKQVPPGTAGKKQ